MMAICDFMDAIRGAPIKWPKNGFVLSFGDVFFKLEMDRKYKDKQTYAASIVVYSNNFARFLDSVAKRKDHIPTCPRIRRVPGTSDIGVFGQSWWIVLKPEACESVDTSGQVDRAAYEPGKRLVSLGKGILLEEKLASFALDAIDTLGKDDGILKAQTRDGFISINCSGFDFFYGFVYACHKAGKSEKECRDLVKTSGVPMQYPESFDVGGISEKDISVLYDALNNQQ